MWGDSSSYSFLSSWQLGRQSIVAHLLTIVWVLWTNVYLLSSSVFIRLFGFSSYFLIRAVGVPSMLYIWAPYQQYGLYVFSHSIHCFFTLLINLVAAKMIFKSNGVSLVFLLLALQIAYKLKDWGLGFYSVIECLLSTAKVLSSVSSTRNKR